VIGLVIGVALGGCTLPEGDQGSLHDQLGDGDVSLAAAALQRSLEQARNGQPTAWRNAATGSAGSITPTRTFLAADGAYCREYEETITIGGRSGRSRNTACRGESGKWAWI
jgi:surface antigen